MIYFLGVFFAFIGLLVYNKPKTYGDLLFNVVISLCSWIIVLGLFLLHASELDFWDKNIRKDR